MAALSILKTVHCVLSVKTKYIDQLDVIWNRVCLNQLLNHFLISEFQVMNMFPKVQVNIARSGPLKLSELQYRSHGIGSVFGMCEKQG